MSINFITFTKPTSKYVTETYKQLKPFLIKYDNGGKTMKLINKNNGRSILQFDYITQETFVSSDCYLESNETIFKNEKKSISELLNDQMFSIKKMNDYRKDQVSLNKETSLLIYKNYYSSLYIDEDLDYFESLYKHDYKKQRKELKREEQSYIDPDDYLRIIESSHKKYAQKLDLYKHTKNLKVFNYVGEMDLKYRVIHRSYELGKFMVDSMILPFYEFNAKFDYVIKEIKGLEDYQKKKYFKKMTSISEEKLKMKYQDIDNLSSCKTDIVVKRPEFKFHLKQSHMDKFQEEDKWFGFRNNQTLNKALKYINGLDIYERIKSLTDIKTSLDFASIYEVILNISSMFKSKQFVAFMHCFTFDEDLFYSSNTNKQLDQMVKTLIPISNSTEKWLDYASKISNMFSSTFFSHILNTYTE